MESRIYLVTIALTVLAAGGCQQQPTSVAAAGGPAILSGAGAAPVMSTPVGPLPGVVNQPPEVTDPFAGNAVALAEGRRLFVHYNCSGCHGGHAGGGMGPSLRDPAWIYGSSDAHVFESIAQGRAHGMPSWGTLIPEEEIWKIVAYIKSMRTPDEPDKPE